MALSANYESQRTALKAIRKDKTQLATELAKATSENAGLHKKLAKRDLAAQTFNSQMACVTTKLEQAAVRQRDTELRLLMGQNGKSDLGNSELLSNFVLPMVQTFAGRSGVESSRSFMEPGRSTQRYGSTQGLHRSETYYLPEGSGSEMHYSTRPHDEYAPNNGPLKRQAPCSDVRRTTKRPKLAEWSKQDLADAWAELGLESLVDARSLHCRKLIWRLWRCPHCRSGC